MKKKLILFLISAVLPFCCSSCGIIDIAAQLSNTDSSETKISSEEESTNYVEQQFEEKYGKEFYSQIGRKGGQNGHTGGFVANPALARIAGAKGGRISRRGPAKKAA